ncbi:hypothetical protein EV121DRAFT_274605 [Schizophyllum commune]
MAEAVLSFAFRVSHNGLGGVYLEAALAGASGIVALGAKTVSKLREGTRELADESGTPVDARSAKLFNATTPKVRKNCQEEHATDDAIGPTTSLEPVRVAVAELTRRLTVQPPLPTLQSSSSYANINDTELSTNILYAQHDPIDMTSANTNLKYNLTIPAKFVAFNDSSITAPHTDSNVPYATSLPPHITIISICLLGPVLFVLAAIVVRSILRRLYLVFARRPIPTTGHIVEVSSSILTRAVALFRSAALQVEAHTVAFPRFTGSSPSKRSEGNSALAAVKEEGDALEEDAIHGDSAENIDGGAGAQGGDTDAPHDYLDEPVAAAEDIEVGKARIPQEGTELLGTPLSTPRVPTNVLPRSKPMNDADADDDATEPQLPVLARIRAWEQGRRAAGREDDVQAGTDLVKRSGGLLASPVLMDNVDDEEELPQAPVVERIKAWEQARTVVRRASGRKSAGRAGDVQTGAEIADGSDDQRNAPAPKGNDAGARSSALSDGRIEAGPDDADEQLPPVETEMRSVASLKRLYEPFHEFVLGLEDKMQSFRRRTRTQLLCHKLLSRPHAMNARLKNDILAALLKDYAADGIIPDDFPGVSTLQAHSDNPRNRACAIARGQEIARVASLDAIYANSMHMDGPLTTFLFDTLNSPQFLANMVGPILRRAPVEIPVPEAPAQGGMEDGKSDLLHLLLGLAFIENRDTAPQIAREMFEPAVNKAMNIYDARVKFPSQLGLQIEDAVDSEYDALMGSLFDMCLAARQQPAKEVIAPPNQELWRLYARPSNAKDVPAPSKLDKQSAGASTTIAAASATAADVSDAADSPGNAEAAASSLSDDDLDAPGHLAAPDELSGASGSLSATSLDLKRKQSEVGDEGEEEAVEEYLRLKRARELTQ